MSYGFIKWTLFTVIILTVPTLFFLVQVVMFFPAVFFAAGIFYVIPKAFAGSMGESLAFIGIMGVHALVYGAVFYGLAALLAKLISLVPSRAGKTVPLAVIVLGLVGLTFFPLYGGAGHGPSYWMPLLELFAEINRDYGAYTVPIVYGTAILLPGAIWLWRKRRRAGTG